MKIGVTALIGLLLLATLSGCGGKDVVAPSCDDPQPYMEAKNTGRVKVPEGMDDLEEFKEMPIPSAAPRPPRPANAPCIELPPARLED